MNLGVLFEGKCFYDLLVLKKEEEGGFGGKKLLKDACVG